MPAVTVPPNFADGTQGSLLVGGVNGFVASLMEWHYYNPKNSRSMNNYVLSPMSIANANNPYVTVKGGWDLANPPHIVGLYNINYNALVILFLALFYPTHGYLGTFKVVEFNAGHAKNNGSDFDFTAEQQGVLTYLPSPT